MSALIVQVEFSRGLFGVLYSAKHFETALFETMHHHGRFMALTREAPGWTSQFRELVLDISAALHDFRGGDEEILCRARPNSYAKSQQLGKALKIAHSEGLVYPSQRHPGGQCAGLFYPNHATSPIQGRHLDYHWDGEKVDLYRVSGATEVWRVTA